MTPTGEVHAAFSNCPLPYWVMGRTSRWGATVGPLRVHLTLEGDLYNITNHTRFTGAGTIFGSASFGTEAAR
jgi:hypothetical protein